MLPAVRTSTPESTCATWLNSPALFAVGSIAIHTVRFAQPHGLGKKVSDEFTAPLCRAHHRELHRTGRELEWWTRKRNRATTDGASLPLQHQESAKGRNDYRSFEPIDSP